MLSNISVSAFRCSPNFINKVRKFRSITPYIDHTDRFKLMKYALEVKYALYNAPTFKNIPDTFITNFVSNYSMYNFEMSL